MADQGDQTPRSGSNEQVPEQEPVTPTSPIIIVTSAKDSTKDEEVKSSNDLLQASHETEDDGALPKVHSESTAHTRLEPEEKPLVSPEDDEFKVSEEALQRPVSPIDDEEDEQSVTSSRFSDSDSDEEERRGRARRSSRDRYMSPSRTFTTRFDSQEELEKKESDRRRSKEGLAKGERRRTTKSGSPLAIISVTRKGDAVVVTSPTHGTITITDPKVVEELANGQINLSSVNDALDMSQNAQDAIERAFEEQEILKLAESYKNGPKHTPPPVPARPDSPQSSISADAKAPAQRNNPSSQHTKLPGVSAPAETGTLHRRSASKEDSGQFLMQKRYDMIHGDLRRLAVNPSHRIAGWTKDDLWSFIRAQDNKILSIAEVLRKNKLVPEIKDMVTLQDERRFAKSEVEKIKSEFELQTIANEQRIAELETELDNAEAENERLLAEQTINESREAILKSPVKLSVEASEALAKVEKHFEQINTKHDEVSKGMDQLRSQLDLTQQLKNDNNELRCNMELLENQVEFYDHQTEKLKHRMDEQELENDQITKAYKMLQKENAQLTARVQTLQAARRDIEDQNTELKIQLDLCQAAKSELEGDKLVAVRPKVGPVDSFFSTRGNGSEEEPQTLRDSNLSLSGKNSALERLLASTREESLKFRELYNAAEEQRVWSFAHYATVREPWPVATRETIAQLIVTVVNDNRKPVEESARPTETARDIQFERTGLVEDAPLSHLLTRDQVVTWFAAGLGVSRIFDEIRALGLQLSRDTEQEILRVLIEQGLCYGNYDVFSTFVFADRPFSRKDFISRHTALISVMDRLEKNMIKTETDLKLTKDKVTELEQQDRERFTKLEEQDHKLKQARQALETFETYHDHPEGALDELIELQATHANLREELKEVEDANKELQDQVVYYGKELVEARSEAESGVSSTDQGTCNNLAHRDLEARTQDLEKQNQELVAYSRDQDGAAAQMPESPACPHCHKMRRTIADLNLKLRKAKGQALEDWDNAGSPPSSPPGSSPTFQEAASAEPYCNDCAYLSKKLHDARQHSKNLAGKLRLRKNEVRGCNYETDEARHDLDKANKQLQKTQNDLANAHKEIQRLRAEDSSASPSSTSTAPTSTGASSARDSEKDDRIKELEALLEQSQQSLSEKINDSLRKLAAPPVEKENEMWGSFDIEGNASKLAAEKTQLEEQVATTQKNLDMFEAAAKIWEDEANVTASQIENAESVGLHARIENLQRQVKVIPGLKEEISTLVGEKKNLIVTVEYLNAGNRPECCLATRTELQREMDAHAATRKELEDAVDAAAANMNNGASEEVSQELNKVKKELEYATTAHELYVASENNRRADLMVAKPGEDPCKDVKDELEALKIEHTDLKDALRTTSVENENNKRLLKQARIQSSRVKATRDANAEDPCKDIMEELEATRSRVAELQRLLDEKKAKKSTNISAQQHGELIQQIRDLEAQITKAKSAHDTQAKIDQLVQRVRDDAITIAELNFEIGKLEAISKVYVLAGDRHGPPENDHECKDTIMELIAAQTQLKELIDKYRLDVPAKKSEPVEEKKEEKKDKPKPKNLIQSVFSIFKKVTFPSDSTATQLAVKKPVNATKTEEAPAPQADEAPAPETDTDPDNDPCSIYKKQLKDVKKQVDAFEMLTLYKEKFLREQEIVERKDKENMQLKNKLEIVLNDTPVSLRKRLTEALEANRRQANIIGCNEIVAARHHKEMAAIHKKMEILLKPDQIMKDLMTKNFDLEKKLDKVQGKFFKANLESGKKLNFLARQLSELYAERNDWRDSKAQFSGCLWKPAEEARMSKTPESTEAAEVKTSASASETPEVASKTTESAPKTANYETGEDFRGTAENPWPKITYDCWPQPPPRLQKTFDDMYDANEKLYNNPVYVLKDRVPDHPKPDITGLWNQVQNTRWQLTEPKKVPLFKTAYRKFNQYIENEYFLPAVWGVILVLEHLGYNHYTLPTLDFVFGHERGPHSFLIRWASLFFLFLVFYTFWLWHQLRGIFGRPNGGRDGDDSNDQLPKEDPCKDVKKELADTKAELNKAQGSSDKDKDTSKKDDSKEDNSDPCKDIKNEFAITTAKLNDAQAQLNGEKSVIDWKHDKRSNSQWQRLQNTKFWEVAGIPGPKYSNAVTFEEFQRNGGAGGSSEPSVQFASQVGSGPEFRSAPPPYKFEPTKEDLENFDFAAYLRSPNSELWPEFEYPTPEVDAWVDSDDVPATHELGSTSTATGVSDDAATGYVSPFDFMPFFPPAEADLDGLGAAAVFSDLGAVADFEVGVMRDDAESGSRFNGSTNGTTFSSSLKKTASEWIADLNAELAKNPTLSMKQLPFTYSSTDSTPMSYADFIENRLAAPQSANNAPIWLSPFPGDDGGFDPSTPQARAARRYRDGFTQRRKVGQVCCEQDYGEKIRKKLLNPDPSALESPKMCTHRPLGRHGADHLGSPYALRRRPASNRTVETINALYAPDQATLASAWRTYLRKHPHLRRFVAGRNPWERSPAKPGSVNFRDESRERKIMGEAYGIKFPSHGDLTAWRASYALLPPSEQDLVDIDEQRKGFTQIPEHLRGVSGAATSGGPEAKPKASKPFSQIPDLLRSPAAKVVPAVPAHGMFSDKKPAGFPEILEHLKNVGAKAPHAAFAHGLSDAKPSVAFSQIPDHLRNFRVGMAAVPNFNASGKWPDPCRDVKERLAKAQQELDSLMSGDDCAEVRKRVKELHEELKTKTILYDPVREQLTRVEAELAEEKREHEAAKQKVALADPKTIKTNEQQGADVKAQQAALDTAAKDAEKRIGAAEAQTDQFRRRADEYCRALELEKSRRQATPSVHEESVTPPSTQITWRRFWITLALSISLAFWVFLYTTLGQMPMYQDSVLSMSEMLWYDTVESIRENHGLIAALGGIVLVVLLVWAATLASADRKVNPYPDYDDDNDDGKGDDDKKDDGSNGKNNDSLKSPLSLFLPPLPKCPSVKRSTPTSIKSPRGFQTTRQQTWKHSYISSVSTEPTADTSAGVKATDISPYFKELEDRVERLERELLAARTKVSAFTQSAISSIDLRPQAGPRADQKRQALAHSAISSVSSAPQAVNGVVKNVEQKIETNGVGLWNKITRAFTIAPSSPTKTEEDLRAELDNVKKALEDAKEIAANNKQSGAKVEGWDPVETPSDDWMDPCKHVNEELKRVKQELKEARVESSWLRKQKERVEKQRDGVDVDGEDEGNEDDEYPPPGSLELKSIIAEDLVKMRNQQLEKAAEDLKNCHQANVALRKRFYDERDGREAEKRMVEELKQAAASKQTASVSTQTEPVKIEGQSYIQASSGGVDHTECQKRIRDLLKQRDQLRDDRAESDSKCRDAESEACQLRDQLAVLEDKQQRLKVGLDAAVKELDHYKGMYNRGADHGMCLRGGKREILEKLIADYEKDGDQRVAQHEETIKNLRNQMQGLKMDASKRQDIAEMCKLEAQQLRNELSDGERHSRELATKYRAALANEKKAVENLEIVRTQLWECERAKVQIKEDPFAQERLDIASREAKDAKDQLDHWVNQIELNKTLVSENLSSDPEVAKLQRFLFDRTNHIEMLIAQKKRVEENLEWYKKRLKRAFEAEDHKQCKAMEKMYKQQAEMAEDARKEAADKNTQMWYDFLDERTKAYHANEAKNAAEKRVEELEEEKEALTKQLGEKSKVCSPEVKNDGDDYASSEVASKALRDARLATRLAEAETRKLKLDRDRLACENALLTQRLERKIDTLEHCTESKIHGALPPTPISFDLSSKVRKQRPASIITNFSNLEDPFYEGLVTGGITSRLPKFNPNRLLDVLGPPRSHAPARAPIPTPKPPYPSFEPLTPEGRRRSAERMISDPERETALAEERAYLAAVRAVESEFEERRSDGYALIFTILRPKLDIPVRVVAGRLEDVAEEEEEENIGDDRKKEAEDEDEESSDGSLDDEEFNKRYNTTPTPLPRNRRTLKDAYQSP